jgi:hypothetical protein
VNLVPYPSLPTSAHQCPPCPKIRMRRQNLDILQLSPRSWTSESDGDPATAVLGFRGKNSCGGS